MKKYSIIAIAFMLTMALTACRSNDMPNTTDGSTNTMPTVVTTMPTRPTEDNVPGTSFIPDEDGIIGEPDGTMGTETTEPSARMRMIR